MVMDVAASESMRFDCLLSTLCLDKLPLGASIYFMQDLVGCYQNTTSITTIGILNVMS